MQQGLSPQKQSLGKAFVSGFSEHGINGLMTKCARSNEDQMTVTDRDKKAVSSQVDGAYYQRHSSVQFDLANQAVKSLSIGGDESVLDIGCGDGQVTRQLSQVTSGRVLGIDSSESMIAIAKKNDKNPTNLNFQTDSALSVIKGESFDIATCFSVLHWIRETESFFEAAFQNLKPGGKLLILTYPADSSYTKAS